MQTHRPRLLCSVNHKDLNENKQATICIKVAKWRAPCNWNFSEHMNTSAFQIQVPLAAISTVFFNFCSGATRLNKLNKRWVGSGTKLRVFVDNISVLWVYLPTWIIINLFFKCFSSFLFVSVEPINLQFNLNVFSFSIKARKKDWLDSFQICTPKERESIRVKRKKNIILIDYFIYCIMLDKYACPVG